MAITTLALGLTPVFPAGANESSEVLLAQLNQSDITGIIEDIIRARARQEFREQRQQARQQRRQAFREGVQQAVDDYTDFFNTAQTLFDDIEACAASGCPDLGTLLAEAADLVETLPEPPVLP
ncbi:hypothetical protein [Moorena producens]|uniref:hypothetical protein n=1 Tax=Moorena producens TaxID=1155739 RepID=UPI003C76A82D